MIEGFGVCAEWGGGERSTCTHTASLLFVWQTKPIAPRQSGKIGSLYKQHPAIIDTTSVCECMSDRASERVRRRKKWVRVTSVSNGNCNCLTGAVLKRQSSYFSHLMCVQMSATPSIHLRRECPKRCVCHYPHLYHSSHLNPFYTGRLFTCLVDVNNKKAHGYTNIWGL